MSDCLKPNIAIFASGNGSNFEALCQASFAQRLDARIALLVTDRPDCHAVQRAERLGVELFARSPKDYPSKEAFETEVLQILREKKVELIVLAGYMRIVGPVLIGAFPDRIINIHPSLLPAFPGLRSIEQAFRYGVKLFGITIHYVDPGIDTGPIIEQAAFHCREGETLEEIETRIHQLEHEKYPETIQKIIHTLLCKKKSSY